MLIYVCFQASFTVSENRSDIDINDPDFWAKWAKKADIDTEQNNEEVGFVVNTISISTELS